MPDQVGLAIIVSGFSGVFGIIGAVFGKYLNSGRVEKTPIYMTIKECQHTREKCNIAELHLDIETFKAETRSHQKETDKRLNENIYDIRAMRKDISEIKEAQAHSNALLENIAETIKK